MRGKMEHTMKSWWTKAKIEDAIGAWAPFAGWGQCNDVDDRFRAELGEIGPEERALVMGHRLSREHGHLEAGRTPGPWAAVWALRAGFPSEWLPEEPMDIGVRIEACRAHVTGTGRLRWAAMDDGTLRIEVWRGPSADKDPHLVLSAVVRAEARNDEYNDGITCDLVEVEAHAPFWVRHVDTLVMAIGLAMGADYSTFEQEAIRDRIAALGTPERDPWDPELAPAAPPVGALVEITEEEGGVTFLARVTGEGATWSAYRREWLAQVAPLDPHRHGFSRWDPPSAMRTIQAPAPADDDAADLSGARID